MLMDVNENEYGNVEGRKIVGSWIIQSIYD